MNEQLTENEIKKLLEHLNYPSHADIMQQQLFFIQTETIRQQRINDERVVEVLMNISANNPSSSARKEANKTLKHLGITPPPINPKMAKEVKARDIAIGFLGWLIIGSVLGIAIISFYDELIWIEALVFIGLVAYFTVTKYWVAIGLMTHSLMNFLLAWLLTGHLLGWVWAGASPAWLTMPFPTYIWVIFLASRS